MFCTKCGAQIPDNAQSCPQCQEQLQKTQLSQPAVPMQTAKPVEIKSGLVQAILVTLFCCLPFGIVAIVYAAKVSGLVAAGDIAGAQESARKSNMWSWASFIVGLVGSVVYILISILLAAPR